MARTVLWSVAVAFVMISGVAAVEFAPAIVLESPNGKADSYFGEPVASVPDVNGDGKADIIVGGWTESSGDGPDGAGRAYLFDGATGALLREFKEPTERTRGGFGSHVVGIDDLNENGQGEVVINGSGGTIYVFDGSTGDEIHNFLTPAGIFLASITTADIDGDGRSEIVCGFWGDAPIEIYDAVSGEPMRSFPVPNATARGLFGASISGIGDLNENGSEDLVVGAAFADSPLSKAGRAYVLDGSTGAVLHSLTAPESDDRSNGNFGRSVGALGDVNGDDVADFVVGANGLGRAYLFSGADGTVLHTLKGEPGASLLFGWAVAGLPDVSGDGQSDVVVAGFPPTAKDAQVFDGVTGDYLASLPGHTTDGGRGLSGLPDVNGDGLGEVVVTGAFSESSSGQANAGQVYLYLSKPSTAPSDCDEDGLSDDWEYANFGNEGAEGCDLEFLESIAPDGDPDNDDSNNKMEHETGTHPMLADTDEDGLKDGVETDTGTYVSATDTGTNPLNPDTDGDGLRDGTETNTGVFVSAEDTGSNPGEPDSDGDTFSDSQEVAQNSDPNDAASLPNDPLANPTQVWNTIGPLDSFQMNGWATRDVTLRAFVDFDAKTDGDAEVIWETGGRGVGFSLLYESGSKLVLRVAGDYGLDVATLIHTLTPNQFTAGELELIWTFDVDNGAGEQVISLFIDGEQAATLTQDLKQAIWSGQNPASFGAASTEISTTGNNTPLSGSDFTSGTINTVTGLQLFSGILFAGRDSAPPVEAVTLTNIQRAGDQVTIRFPDGITLDFEYSTDLITWSKISENTSNPFVDTKADRVANPAGYYRGIHVRQQ